MKKQILIAFALLFISYALEAQRICGNTPHDSMLMANDAAYAHNRLMIEKFTQRYIEKKKSSAFKSSLGGGDVITIPVVVHVVYKTDEENISDDQVESQIDVLNEDFRRLNLDASETPDDFEDDAADLEIEFCFATVDPDGNLTNGIHRVETDVDSWSTDDAVKFDTEGGADAWPEEDYLNIWCCRLVDGLLGYAQFPGGAGATDGVVITYSSFGREGFVIPPYDLGRTGTHEVGHWVNLIHIWGDDSDCSGSDLCDDTPNQEVSTYGCPSHPASDDCSAAYQFQNYMDYTDDACYNMFTEDQKDRAIALFEAGGARFDLGNSTKCVSYNYDAGIVEITSPFGTYCYDTFDPVILITNSGLIDLTSVDIDYSIDGGSTSTYYWTGSLETGEEESVSLPTISLTEGPHSIAAAVNNPNGSADENSSNNEAYNDFVVNVTGYALPLVQGFEDGATFPYVGYTIVNPDEEITWERTSLAAKTGGSSMYINTFNISDIDEVDEIYLPAYNMEGVTTAHLDFDLANAAYSVDEDFSDTLEVLVSGDCGITWESIYRKSKPDLATAPATGANFVPTNAQWRNESIDLTPYLADKIIVRFRSVSNWENNTFIDNINLNSGSVAIQNTESKIEFNLFPIPVNNLLNISYYLQNPSELDVLIYNILGDIIYTEKVAGHLGNNTATIDVSEIPAGHYTIKMQNNENISAHEFVKQ